MISAMRRKFYRKHPGKLEEVEEADLIDDNRIDPASASADFLESYDQMYHDIEAQRGRLEELACFERQVDIRERLRHKQGSLSSDSEEEISLAALAEAHNSPPRILNSSDFVESDNFTMRSSVGRHRMRIRPEPIIPYNILVARSVSRSE